MKKFLPVAACCVLIYACRNRGAKEEAIHAEDKSVAMKIEMMNADRAFSVMSEKHGLRKAYAEFIDSNGVLLRPGALPMAGGDAVDYITQSNDTSFLMTWEPKDASISASGDMGFTYGVYSLKPKAEDSVYYGSYVTIWKKQADGRWKFVLQSGNEGVE